MLLWLNNFNWFVLVLTYYYFCLDNLLLKLFIDFFYLAIAYLNFKFCLFLIFLYHFVEIPLFFLYYFLLVSLNCLTEFSGSSLNIFKIIILNYFLKIYLVYSIVLSFRYTYFKFFVEKFLDHFFLEASYWILTCAFFRFHHVSLILHDS